MIDISHICNLFGLSLDKAYIERDVAELYSVKPMINPADALRALAIASALNLKSITLNFGSVQIILYPADYEEYSSGEINLSELQSRWGKYEESNNRFNERRP